MGYNESMTRLADAVRAKSGATGKLTVDQMTEAVNGITSGGGEGGGGTDTSDATVTADKLLKGVTAYGADGKVTGEIETVTPTLTDNVFTVPKGYVEESQTLTVAEALAPSVSENIVTIKKGYHAEEKKVTVGTAKAAATITPSTADQTIAAGTYLTGKQTIKGDTNLIADNIKKDVSIFGLVGTFEGESSGGGMAFYKCASTNVSAKTWSGYKAVLLDGVYTFETFVVEGLTYGTGFTPKQDGIYDATAMIRVSKLWDGNPGPSVTGWVWGYANGEVLPDNEITASARGGLTAVGGVYTLGNGKYFEFNEQVMTGSSPRTFLFHAVLTEGSNAQFVDGGTQSGYQVFSVNWGATANYVAHHFWDFDNRRFASLSSGEHIIAIVYDGSELIVYADKTEIGRTEASIDTGTDKNYTFGYHCIDDWALEGEWLSKYCVVYDKALTAEEIGTVTDEINKVIA